jgi:subfamily B ATP-binding cassette protein MsbA
MKIRKRHKVLFALIAKKKMHLLLAILCMLIVASATSATAYLVKPIIDEIFLNKDRYLLNLLPIAVILTYLLKNIGVYGQEYFMGYIGESIIKQLRDSLYSKIMDLPLSFFHFEKTGVLMSRITNDVSIIKATASTAITSAMKDIFTIIGLTSVVFYMDWKMASFAFFVLPPAFYPVIKIAKRIRIISVGCQEAMGEMNSFLHETFSGNKIVKAFGQEGYEKKRFFEKTFTIFKLELKAIIARALTTPIMDFLGGLGAAFIIWYGGSQVIDGSITTGTFFSFMSALFMLYGPIKDLSSVNNTIQQGLAAIDRVFDVIEKESDIYEDNNPIILDKVTKSVSFKNVSFKYKKDFVLKNINLRVEPGEVLALAGMSGGGKTSLVNLIPRFYDVTEGEITIDGINICKFSIDSLRKQIAVVTQEPILFNDTVRNNIAYGKRNASDYDIEEAAKAAYAYEFIKKLPNKLDTNIGELGGRLSGGERQRLCIARALLKNAPILILDEATSALDTEAERLVQKALENLMKGRTTFVIAHRLSTIEKANKIAVIVGGEVIEEGSHKELILKKGEYYKLYKDDDS